MKVVLLLAAALLSLWALFWLWTPDKARSELEARYLSSPKDMIDLAGWHLRLRDTGPRDAPAVIMLHGFGASLETWDLWADRLSVDHRVIRFDLPGSGLSSPDPTGDYTDARTMQLLIAIMDRLGLARASLVGHSIGGRMAWTFAALHPERVDRLVLVAPDGFASPGFTYGQAPAVPATFSLMRYVLPKPLLRSFLASAYARPGSLTDARLERYGDLMRAPGARDAMLARMKQTVLVDPIPLLEKIRAPTLLVWGAQDQMIPAANSAEYLKAIKNVQLLEVPGAGHLVQEEAPEAVAAVAAFLRPGISDECCGSNDKRGPPRPPGN